jgi:hypothetical protein
MDQRELFINGVW